MKVIRLDRIQVITPVFLDSNPTSPEHGGVLPLNYLILLKKDE